MIGVTAKYYLQDNRDTDEQYNVFRCRVSAFMNKNWGAVARYDYMENAVTKDSAFLVGPALMF